MLSGASGARRSDKEGMARPTILDPLFRSLRSIKGVGPQMGALLDRFFQSPEGQEPLPSTCSCTCPPAPSTAVAWRAWPMLHNNVATLKVHVDRHVPPPPGKKHLPHRVRHPRRDRRTAIWSSSTPVATGWKRLSPWARPAMFPARSASLGTKQITHPDFIVSAAEFEDMPLVEPVYPLTHGLSSRAMVDFTGRFWNCSPTCQNGSPANAAPSSGGRAFTTQ